MEGAKAMDSPRKRMLRLLSLLQTGRRWTASALAEASDSTPRTLRRDIEFLRELGYPVSSTRGPGGFYQLLAGRSLPPLILEDDEALATVLGLRLSAAGEAGNGDTAAAAARAEEKIRRLLPPKLRRRTEQVLAAVEVSGTNADLPSPSLLQILGEAVTSHRALYFSYAPKSADLAGAESDSPRLHVEPARLLRLQQRWYLFSWDRDRRDWRTFRLDRITSEPLNSTSFHPRPLPAEDLVAYLREHFRGIPELTVTLLLHASAEEAARRLYRVDGSLEPIDENSCRYTAHVDSFAWLSLVLVLSEVEFTILEPPAFREEVTALAHRLIRGTRRGQH
ncbi:helix-turn-helix transcriptional regulator [Corynebacterium flavescens]|uniref:helix-turn-helix transcriptional regulator n=1 Tax=Corynebacterium flavescens TaxID=28028 RepID=UPI002647DEEF|nr:YafY family protein [Corynebacterium flavescens]MDN6200445.1 YafY family transcriptional regulator [Corynebacterium flavescens]